MILSIYISIASLPEIDWWMLLIEILVSKMLLYLALYISCIQYSISRVFSKLPNCLTVGKLSHTGGGVISSTHHQNCVTLLSKDWADFLPITVKLFGKQDLMYNYYYYTLLNRWWMWQEFNIQVSLVFYKHVWWTRNKMFLEIKVKFNHDSLQLYSTFT